MTASHSDSPLLVRTHPLVLELQQQLLPYLLEPIQDTAVCHLRNDRFTITLCLPALLLHTVIHRYGTIASQSRSVFQGQGFRAPTTLSILPNNALSSRDKAFAP